MRRILLSLLIASTALAACKSKKGDDKAVATETTTETPNTDETGGDDTKEEEDVPSLPLPADPKAALPLDDKITTGVLDNGLTYYILPNQVPANRAEFWMSINAGSFQEADDQRGLAHFLEHMAFNGTTSFPKNELIKTLEELGVDFGAHLNAHTAFDETVYKLRLPTDEESSIDLGLQILSEWISGITLDPEEFEKERGVVLAEKRSGDGPQMRLMQNLIQDALEGTRYANRLPIGTPEVLKTAPVGTIRKFYEDWYHPANAAVYVVGDVDAVAIEKKIQERFGAIAAKKEARVAPERTMPKGGKLKFLNLQDKELPMTAVGVGRFVPAKPLESMEDFRREFVETLAATLLSKRMEEARGKGEVSFLMGGAAVAPIVRSLRIQATLAMLAPNKVMEGTRDLLTEVERVRRHGFTQGELNRGTKEVIAALENMTRNAISGKESSSDLVEELTRYHLQKMAMPGRQMELSLMRHFAEQVTPDELNKVFADVFNPDGLVAASLGSAEEPPMSEEEFKKLLDEVAKADIQPYEDAGADVPLMKQKPAPGTIASKSYDEPTDIHTWVLSNGATVHLKKTDFKSDGVLFRAHSYGGKQGVKDADLVALASAAELVTASGLGELDRAALDKVLSGKSVEIAPYIDAHEEGMRGSSSTGDVETLLALTHLYFEAPRKDEVAAGALKDTLVTSMRQQNKDPKHLFNKALHPKVTNADPRQVFMEASTAEKVDLDESFALFQERFSSAGDFHFYFVGDFELDTIEPLILSYLGSLPAGELRETHDRRVWPHNSKREEVTVSQGSQDRAEILLVYNREHEAKIPSMEERLALEAFERAARMHILAIFREELGESYGAGVRISWSPTTTTMITSLQSSPKSAKKIAKQLEAEVAKLVAGGIGQEQVTNALEAMRKADDVNLERNDYWLERMVELRETGDQPSEILAKRKAIEALTLDTVKKVIAEQVDEERPVVAVLVPKG